MRGFARVAVAAFVTPLDPTLQEVADVKTAVSEAVTNAIIHGYADWGSLGQGPGKVVIRCCLNDDVLHIEVEDKGRGIEDVEKAMEPLYTTRPDMDRSGMGFAFMEAFMDDLDVESEPGEKERSSKWKKSWEPFPGRKMRSSAWRKYQY